MRRYSKAIAAGVSSCVAIAVALGYLSETAATAIADNVGVIMTAATAIAAAVYGAPANTDD